MNTERIHDLKLPFLDDLGGVALDDLALPTFDHIEGVALHDVKMPSLDDDIGGATMDDVLRNLSLSPKRSRRARRVKQLLPRQTKFAIAIAAGMNRLDAQRAAGYRRNFKHARLLLGDHRIARLIETRKAKRKPDLFTSAAALHA